MLAEACSERRDAKNDNAENLHIVLFVTYFIKSGRFCSAMTPPDFLVTAFCENRLSI